MTKKYKLGDKVRVRRDLITNTSYGNNTFMSSMSKYCGKLATITSTYVSDYNISIDHDRLGWTDGMLEPASSKTQKLAKEMLK